MRVWKVEVWIMIKDEARWENWADEYVLTNSIEEAIKEAKKKQVEEYKPFAIEVRTASIESDITIEAVHTDEKEAKE